MYRKVRGMLLIASSNRNMDGIIGKNFVQRRLPNGKTEFANYENGELQCSFVTTVKHYRMNDDWYLVISEHSTYEFQLLQGESIVCGEYFATPVNNGLWEMEHV